MSILKVAYPCINSGKILLLIHGFSPVNARLLKVFGNAFYAKMTFKTPDLNMCFSLAVLKSDMTKISSVNVMTLTLLIFCHNRLQNSHFIRRDSRVDHGKRYLSNLYLSI